MPVVESFGSISARATGLFGRVASTAVANPGQIQFVGSGTVTWVVPTGVNSVSVCCIGNGGTGSDVSGYSGGGGELRYKNNITVTPGSSITVAVGNSGGAQSTFNSTTVVAKGGGNATDIAGGAGGSGGTGDGGGNGGAGHASKGAGGGGAGGYSGAGGAGASNPQSAGTGAGSNGTGGSSAGGGYSDTAGANYIGYPGGGTGVKGTGTSGSGVAGAAGGGGSGGLSDYSAGNFGPFFGGGGSYTYDSAGATYSQTSPGGPGAVRIIWGSGRSYPSNALDVLVPTLRGMGSNAQGQLAVYNTLGAYSSPVQVGGGAFNTASSIAALYHTMSIKTDGTLWAWGQGSQGALGLGTVSNRSSPSQVGALTSWATVSVGYLFNLTTKTDGSLWAWGYNNYGQLGDGTVVDKSSPIQIGALTTWSKVAAGYAHSLALKTDGTLWAWGRNDYGQLGLGDTTDYSSPVQVGALTNWASISAGDSTSLAVKTDGTLWGWGLGTSGQLGDGTATSKSSPIQIGALTTWSSVASGNRSSFAIKTDGTLWSWGAGTSGVLGSGATASRSSPVQVGALTTWASVYTSQASANAGGLTTGNALWVWGANGSGQLGDGTTVDKSSPIQVGGLNTYKVNLAAVGNARILFNTVDSAQNTLSLWSWGLGTSGQLGDSSTASKSSPVQVSGTVTSVSDVFYGNGFAGVVKSDGTLWMWGQGSNGKLGDGTTAAKSSPIQIGALTNWSKLSLGNSTGYAIKTDGTLWAWGYNVYGNLGDGTTVAKSSPIQVGALTTWSKVFAGDNSAAALKTDGTLWVWGYNANGELGLGDTTNRSSPVQLGTGTNWSAAAFGNAFAIATKTNGTLWAWGNNVFGQLGSGNTTNTSSPNQVGSLTNWTANIVAGIYSSYAVKSDGTLWAWGDNSSGRLGDSSAVSKSSPVQIGSLTTWSQVFGSSGASNLCAIRVAGADGGLNSALFVAGVNTAGQLGTGNTTVRSSPVQLGSYTAIKAANGTNFLGGYFQ